ncbi:branched-chain amino acid ABC transporter permease [Agrobacterium sp. NPDC090273]|uniref:branched-chain amino acid ABC transporter permease n=1 Tax=Agrobacterium sp. NPDC090273 TaxID=3363919 RepID=UPI003839F0CF
MDLYLIILLDVLNRASGLFILCLGLAILFGMMRVINLAHGEFVMIGAYATVISANAGVNIWISILVVAPLVTGAVGIVVERVLIRHLYGRLVDSMLATWGLSLLLIGLVTTFFGNTMQGVPTPLGSFRIGLYSASWYTIFTIGVALALLAATYGVLRFTRAGMVARAVMQNPAMAQTLGVNPSTVYMTTFAVGAAVSGLAGGIIAPVSGITPVMGMAFIAKSFITVVSGGSAILVGTATASGIFGTINQLATFFTTPVYGEVILFVCAIILIRLLPQGITGRFFKGRL